MVIEWPFYCLISNHNLNPVQITAQFFNPRTAFKEAFEHCKGSFAQCLVHVIDTWFGFCLTLLRLCMVLLCNGMSDPGCNCLNRKLFQSLYLPFGSECLSILFCSSPARKNGILYLQTGL